MTYQFKLSLEAERDLHDIFEYTLKNFGQHQYWKYRDVLKQAIELIQSDPYNIASQERTKLDSEARTYNIKRPSHPVSHFLLYRVNEGEKVVELARVLHKSIDIKRQLPEDFK
mgnify:CR=1 FL=1